MADPHDDLTAIADEVRRATVLPSAGALRDRSDRRRRRRLAAAGAGLVVLAATAGTALATRDRATAPALAPPSPLPPSATASAGPQDILAGRRQIRIGVPGLRGTSLAIGPGDDRVRAGTVPSLWVLTPSGGQFRIRSGRLCMTVVHDAAPGSVRARACDPAATAQLFRIDRQDDGTYSLFQGRRYVQVVDGTNALVPDLPEALTTTYEFEDRGPAPASPPK